MNAKSWHHVSPTVGVSVCDAKSPATCRYKNAKHFSAEAATRIKNGNPANYNEHEAMRQHQEILTKRKMETGAGQPKPSPSNFRPQPPQKNRFPTGHRSPRPRMGDEVLYHREIGFPKNFIPPRGRKKLEYSRHALDATLDDRYGRIPVLNSISPEKLQLIEMGVRDGKISKFVYRGRLDEERDMCIVVIPKGRDRPWFVKTVWINLRSDQHRTLNKERYAQPV